MAKVRGIIRANMTVIRFLYSNNDAEGYFQYVCQIAYGVANCFEEYRYHPYSFQQMRSLIRSAQAR